MQSCLRRLAQRHKPTRQQRRAMQAAAVTAQNRMDTLVKQIRELEMIRDKEGTAEWLKGDELMGEGKGLNSRIRRGKAELERRDMDDGHRESRRQAERLLRGYPQRPKQ